MMFSLLRSGMVVGLLRGTVVAIIAITQFLMAKFMGVVELGAFFKGFSLIMILSVFLRLGMDSVIVRSAAEFFLEEKKEGGSAFLSIMSSVLLSMFLIIFGFYSDPLNDLIAAEQVAIALFFSVSMVCAFVYQGKKKFFGYICFSGGGFWVLFLSFVLISLSLGKTLTANYAGGLLFFSSLLIMLTALASLSRIYFFDVRAVFNFRNFNYFKQSIPLLGASLSSVASVWLPTYMLASLVGDEYAGTFIVAQRISILIVFLFEASGAVYFPYYVSYIKQGSKKEAVKLMQDLTMLNFLLAFGVSVFVVVFIDAFLLMLGSSYEGVEACLYILVVGQLFNVGSGWVTNVLVVEEKQKTIMQASLAGVLILIFFGYFFARRWGVYGMSFAVTMSIVFTNLVLVIVIRRVAGFWMISFSRFRFYLEKGIFKLFYILKV